MSPEDIDLEIEQLNFKKDAWLRKKGWNHTSGTPGCLWLWKKEIPSHGVVLVNRDSAIWMQNWLDNNE